jgi:hypothetical protein
MRRVDVHQHFWTEELIAALSRRREPPRLDGTLLELREGSFETDLSVHDLDRRLELLDRDGVEGAVVCFPPTIGFEEAPELAEAYDHSILEVAEASRGRLLPLACGEEQAGFVGTCVSAERMARDPHRIAGTRVFVHPGYAPGTPDGKPGWWNAVVHYTAVMQAAYAAWVASGRRDATVVFAIMAGGAPFHLERLASRGDAFEVPANVYFDTASYGARAVGLAIEACGPERIVYGSDAPVMDPRTTIDGLAGLFEDLVENGGRVFA